MEEGFDDYISKPVDGMLLESLLLKYLVKQGVPVQMMNKEQNDKENKVETVIENVKPEEQEILLDTEKGLKYCAGLEEMYIEVLQMFCDLSQEKMQAIKDAYEAQKTHYRSDQFFYDP